MNDKFNMTLSQNIAYAKRNLVDSIYNSAKLEGLNVTFPETYTILEKAKMQNVDISAVSTILNLKHAWQFLLKNIEEPITLDFIKDLHYEIAKDEALAWGELRTGRVGIGGTDYVPPIPEEGEVKTKLLAFEKINNATERAIERMLWMMKAQLFWDGNKRTASLIANKDLISHGKGILTIREKDILEFNTLLSHYYSTDEKTDLINMIYKKAISGVELREKDLPSYRELKDQATERMNLSKPNQFLKLDDLER